jgi:hypothetical protein
MPLRLCRHHGPTHPTIGVLEQPPVGEQASAVQPLLSSHVVTVAHAPDAWQLA